MIFANVGFVVIYLMKIKMVLLLEGLEDLVFISLLSFYFILLNYAQLY